MELMTETESAKSMTETEELHSNNICEIYKMNTQKTPLSESYNNVPAGQLSNTCLAMSVAESFGEKVKSCVFPLTRIRRRCT